MKNKSGFMEKMIGKEIYLNSSGNKKKGPDALSGTLLDCKGDFMVVATDDGVKYLRRDHIKMISESFNNNSNNQDDNNNNNVEVYEAESFHDLLKKSRYKYCVVSSGGPHKVEGILEDADETFVSIVSENEYVQIPLFHVRSIDFSVQNNNNKDKNDKK